jgi:hypothetical protein
VPLTFAHPAIVLPLRRWFLFAALACGAMAPDILYFLPVSKAVDRRYGHVFPGLVTFSVPAAILLWLLWRYWLRDAVIALLPTEEQQKWKVNQQPFDPRSARAWLMVLVAVVIGIASHVFLDGFSHRDGWGTEHIGLLTETGVRVAHRDLAVYKVIQYFGSLVGLGILAGWYLWWSERVPRDRTWKPQFSRMTRALVIGLISLGALYWSYRVARLYQPGERAAQVAGTIIAGTRVVFVGLMLWGVVVRFVKKQPQTQPQAQRR